MRSQLLLLCSLLLAGSLLMAGCSGDKDVDLGDNSGGNDNGSQMQDQDNDGIPDDQDNCPADANNDQAAEHDPNGEIGDACNGDFDDDGVPNKDDNCPTVSNPDQKADDSHPNIGDACYQDSDQDGDGVDDGVDNCPKAENPDQLDLDGNGVGDACDDDKDGDGIPNDEDNCPYTANHDQDENACKTDDGKSDKDGDGVADDGDNCPTVPNPDQIDSNGDGKGDACEPPPYAGGGDNGGGDNGGENPSSPLACSHGDNSSFIPINNDESAGSKAEVTEATKGICLGCNIKNRGNIIDDDLSNAANLSKVLGVASSEQITVTSMSGGFAADSGKRYVGFVVANSKNNLLNLNLIQGLRVSLLKGGGVVDKQSNPRLLNLDLLGVVGTHKRYFVGFQTDQDFDAVRLESRSLVDLGLSGAQLDVYAACVSKPGTEVPDDSDVTDSDSGSNDGADSEPDENSSSEAAAS